MKIKVPNEIEGVLSSVKQANKIGYISSGKFVKPQY